MKKEILPSFNSIEEIVEWPERGEEVLYIKTETGEIKKSI